MSKFVHPSKEDITLPNVLNALGDPVRMNIMQKLMRDKGCLSCSEASPCGSIPKSTLSHHFRILREAGLIRTVKQGVEHQNTVRYEDIEGKFPGLLKTIMKYANRKA